MLAAALIEQRTTQRVRSATVNGVTVRSCATTSTADSSDGKTLEIALPRVTPTVTFHLFSRHGGEDVAMIGVLWLLMLLRVWVLGRLEWSTIAKILC